MIVLSYAPAYGIEICDARRFTAEEKTHYVEWFADRGFVGMGNTVKLDKITFNDLPDRQPDGEFCGCYNSAWIITEDEATLYKKLNTERQDAADRAQADADAAAIAKEQAHEQERQDCLAQFDSWKVSDVKKQDDDLSVEHTFILNGKEFHFIERNIFDFGTVVNPTTVKGGAFLMHDDKEGWIWNTGDSHIALNADEITCVQAISKFGKFVGMPVRM